MNIYPTFVLHNKFRLFCLKWACLFSLLTFSAGSLAAALEDIEFRPLDQDRFEVVLSLDGMDYDDPQVFAIEQPARLVLDLPGVTNQVAEKQFPLTLNNASEAILLGTPERTRLVINMNNPVSHNLQVSGSSVRLVVGSSAGGSVQAPRSQSSSIASRLEAAQTPSTPSGDDLYIEALDFRRGEVGEGNILFELEDDEVNADVSVSGNTIEVRFFDVSLQENLQRIFDVQDFATPVSTFSAETIGGDSVIEITTIEPFEYLAYQTDTSYVVSVKPRAQPGTPGAENEFSYTGEKLSLNFQDIEVRAVLQLIADFTELNLVASDTVNGSITLRLQNVPWDQALDIVLKAKGLDQRREGNVLLVAPIAEIAERERLEIEASRQLQELAPLSTEYIRIRYADAAQLYQLLSSASMGGGSENGEGAPGLLSPRGSAIVDQRTNTIVLTDVAEKITSFRRMVDELDIPIRQVLIEARIVIASNDFRRELGVRWGGTGVNFSDSGDSVVQYGATRSDVGGQAINFFNGTADGVELVPAVDLGVASATTSFAVSFLTDSAFVDLELSALESEGYGEVISQPKVLTGDKQTAYIKSGSEVAYQEAASSGATTTAFREAVLELEVTPQITPDDRVILDLLVAQDSIGDLVFGGEPTIDTTELGTQVLVDSGETLVLGGIFRMTQTESEDKVPLLGDLPIVGNAFKNTLTNSEKQEILIFITPKIIDENVTSR